MVSVEKSENFNDTYLYSYGHLCVKFISLYHAYLCILLILFFLKEHEVLQIYTQIHVQLSPHHIWWVTSL